MTVVVDGITIGESLHGCADQLRFREAR